jgi:hypothetical protein
MGRRIRYEIAGVTAIAELYDDLSPRMAEAVWSVLPLDVTLVHVKWSGFAGFFQPGEGPWNAVTELEYPVCSIYPGTLVARPGGSELLLAYGPSEYRWAIGVDYVTPVAKTVENRPALIDVLARMHSEGDKPLTIRREA